MRSIAMMNQKGGVGKTTTSVNVSAALAASGAKVCLIDLDPQAHATLHFGIDTQSEAKSVYDVLIGKMKLAEVRQQINDNLWLVPAHLDMVGAELELASAVGRELILRDELAEDNLQFDYLFIDCPPSLGLFTLNALTAVKEVFVPLQPHYFSLHGFMRLLETLEAVSKRLNKALKLSGIILCMYDETRLASEVAQDIATFIEHKETLPKVCSEAHIFGTKIRRNIRLAEAPSFGHSIFEYDAHSNGAEDYRKLAEEILIGTGSGSVLAGMTG
ncbi:chromosome partitioning protein ParA [Planctomycetales bacterium]|nr:chromosome partitioning protein ParA [Planctomycetales bacterium]